MKKILITGYAFLFVSLAKAQQKEGTITYERTVQLQINFAGMGDGMQQIPSKRTDKFELTFAK